MPEPEYLHMETPLTAPDAATTAAAESMPAKARAAYWRVMKGWNGRTSALNAKLDEAWNRVAEVIEAEATARERQRIRQVIIDRAVEMGYEPDEVWGLAFAHLADFVHDLLDGYDYD